MNSVAETFQSPRFQRYMLWFGVVVLAVGAAVLVAVILGGNSGAPVKNDKGFHPALPTASVPLRNTDGVLIKTFLSDRRQFEKGQKRFEPTARERC